MAAFFVENIFLDLHFAFGFLKKPSGKIAFAGVGQNHDDSFFLFIHRRLNEKYI